MRVFIDQNPAPVHSVRALRALLADAIFACPDGIDLRETPYGLGLFATRDFAAGEVIYRCGWFTVEDAPHDFVTRVQGPSGMREVTITNLHSANGSTVATAPSSIRITFNEPVTIDAAVVRDSSGVSIPSGAQVSGATMTLTPASPLRQGITTATFSVTSDDGHHVEGALSFVIGRPPVPGPAQAITTMPAVRTMLSGSHPSRLTASFGRRATSGEVVWTSPSLEGSLTWPVRQRGKASSATGVLPFAGTWTMRATLASASGAIVVTTGTATLTP